MDKVNILNQMAEYDFNSPINVTMVFEDSDDESNSLQSNTKEKCVKQRSGDFSKELQNAVHMDNTSNSQDVVITHNKEKGVNPETEELRRYRIKNINNNIPNNTHITTTSRKRKSNDRLSLNDNSKMNQDKKKICSEKGICDISMEKTSATVPNINKDRSNDLSYQLINDYEQVSNHIKNLLDTLSENIILIVESYYSMRKQLRTCNDIELRNKTYKTYEFVKSSVLDSSYSTLVGLILPQEDNTTFINSFLDRTVQLANNKKLLVYNRCHIDPIYKDMLHWTKQKKSHLHTLYNRNQNPILKQHLLNPPMTPNVPATKFANHSSENGFLFSPRPPEREITITPGIDRINFRAAGSYIQATNINNNIENRYDRSCQERVYSPSLQELNYLTNNINATPLLRPPPPYNMHNSNHFPRPREIQLFNQVTQNQVDITRRSESTESGYGSPPYQSPSVTPLDGGTECVDEVAEPPSTFTPIISSVVSLNPGFTTSHSTCRMCGKVVRFKDSESPNLENYCSYICRQLDVQFQNFRSRKS